MSSASAWLDKEPGGSGTSLDSEIDSVAAQALNSNGACALG